MIYEFRTYNLRPGTVPEAIKRFGEDYEHRKKYSELAAFWYTEIGPLNQIIHVWPFEDLGHRERVRKEAFADPNWPPDIGEFQLGMLSEIFIPFPDSPALEPGTLGPVYEMRSYSIKPRMMPKFIKAWNGAIGGRTELSPVVAAMYSDIGPLNKFVQIWPYADLEERRKTRHQAVDSGVWPPPGGVDFLVSQENKILLPAPFSPMQ